MLAKKSRNKTNGTLKPPERTGTVSDAATEEALAVMPKPIEKETTPVIVKWSYIKS